MSQYGSNTPPAGYVPQNQAQQHNAQQLHSSSPYQPNAPHNVHSSHPRPGGAFGQMMNQAVTTGVPMLNKLGKTISSKWVGKPPSSGSPQHLQTYQTYQDHHSQQNQKQGFHNVGQAANNPVSQPPWQQLQQQHLPPPPPPPQQQLQQQQSQGTLGFSPPQLTSSQQTSYEDSASGHSGQGSYFGQQVPQPMNTQNFHSTHPGSSAPAYGAVPFSQNASLSVNAQIAAQYAQHMTNHSNPAQYHANQQDPAHATGQQSGVVSGPQAQSIQSPPLLSASPDMPGKASPQSQWELSTPNQGQSLQGGTPELPNGTIGPQPAFPLENQQSWSIVLPTQMQSDIMNTTPRPANSPLPIPSMTDQRPAPHVAPLQSHSSAAATFNTTSPSAPAEFIAELPADLDSLSIADAKIPKKEVGYQAYHPPSSSSTSPSPGFTIPRRTISTSNIPFADPWRFADPVTERPTREFYVLADLLFDTMDRKFEPQNTGLLEAPKILKSWTELTEEAAGLFSFNWYSAIGKMWSLEGIPHVMVPLQPALSPVWQFNEPSHGQHIKIEMNLAPLESSYATYVPALNRAGWYKFFFLEMMHAPDDIAKLIPVVCAETYKPALLHQPDLAKRERAEAPGLMARAAEIQTAAVNRVCDETKMAMTHAAREGAR